VPFGNLANVTVKTRLGFGQLGVLLGLCVGYACASNPSYRIDKRFELNSSAPLVGCAGAPAYVVEDVPVADRVLGDLVVACGDGCPRSFAERALMQLAEQHGAAHVSSLSCVRRGSDWLCVGRASAPAHCDEGA
jgi:hypothetical protein